MTVPIPRPVTKLMLGTAQFGMPYGVIDHDTVPDDRELAGILKTAKRIGIGWIDTAAHYGSAEARLGALRAPSTYGIVTKIPSLATIMSERRSDDPIACAMMSLDHSRAKLGMPRIDVALLHDACDAARPGVLDALADAQADGRIGGLGVSVYTPDEAVRWTAEPRISHLQVPCNAIDHRWNTAAWWAARSARPDITVYARSAFLQGLLLAAAADWPAWVDRADDIVAALDGAADALPGGRAELCLRYHRSVGWIDASVVGVKSVEQLREIAAAAVDTVLPMSTLDRLSGIAAMVPDRLLDPRQW